MPEEEAEKEAVAEENVEMTQESMTTVLNLTTENGPLKAWLFSNQFGTKRSRTSNSFCPDSQVL